ncbi:helix-turn-helix transcriptional regulator [Streptomyces sp. NPDC002599]|uniref:helix-turn-helix domain-containing protein n=1 Tax=Streptomyces sp. NPDC002599 TaxID=3154421 RepID=UPI003322694A
MSTPSAAEQRLRLRTELRRAREAAGLTQRQVADEMEWSPSKLLRIESGEVGVSVNDLRPLLAAYGITDRRLIETLLDLARGSRKMPYAEYRDVFSKEFLQFLALEASASHCRYFNSVLLPRLLQTEEYARAVAVSYVGGKLNESHERMLEAQLSRQELLQGEDGPQVQVVLDEAVLHRQVGGRRVMRAQLLRIAELCEHPRVTVGIIPYTVGAHPGMQGPFTLFEFAGQEMPDSLHLENLRGEFTSTPLPADTPRFLELFWQLEDLSIKQDVGELVQRLAQRIDEGADDLAVLLQE